MVSHAEIMSFLKRNAEYNDMRGSTNGAGAYMGGYASDAYGDFPQAIGGCNMCGGAYIGGAYIGGCGMCMGGAKKRGPRHCVEAKQNKLGKLSCAKWKEGHLKKQLSLAQLYAKMKKPKKSSKVEKMMQSMAMADALVPKKSRSKFPEMVILPPQIEAQLASQGIHRGSKGYRQCAEYFVGPNGKRRCKKYNIIGKPAPTKKQEENAYRLGLLSKLYSAQKLNQPLLTRADFFADAKVHPTSVLEQALSQIMQDIPVYKSKPKRSSRKGLSAYDIISV